MSAVPAPNPALARQRKPIVLQGDVPNPINPPDGCRFHPRCPRSREGLCDVDEPQLRELGPGHYAACHLPLEHWPMSEEELKRPSEPSIVTT